MVMPFLCNIVVPQLVCVERQYTGQVTSYVCNQSRFYRGLIRAPVVVRRLRNHPSVGKCFVGEHKRKVYIVLAGEAMLNGAQRI
jgi:hypothetical protein